MPAGTLESIIADCEYDHCLTQDENVVCEALETFYQLCLESLNIVVEYRSETLCGKCLVRSTNHLFTAVLLKSLSSISRIVMCLQALLVRKKVELHGFLLSPVFFPIPSL